MLFSSYEYVYRPASTGAPNASRLEMNRTGPDRNLDVENGPGRARLKSDRVGFFGPWRSLHDTSAV